MSCSEDFKEEVEALKSIYENNVKYEKSEITITLFPLQEKEKEEIHVQVDLCMVGSQSYPDKDPELLLKNVKGLTNVQIENLYHDLKHKAKNLRGQAMMYDLAHLVQEFLYKHNKPGKKSCYEEMIIRQEQEKEEKHKTELHKKNTLLKNIEEKQKEMLESIQNSSSNDDSDEDYTAGKPKNDCSDLVKLNTKSKSLVQKKEHCFEHRNRKYMEFHNKILRGWCMGHNSDSVIYYAIDSTTGNPLLLQEWIIKQKIKNHEVTEAIKEKLQTVQEDLEKLKKLSHENLVSYVDYNFIFEKSECVIHVLQECVSSFNLENFIEFKLDLNINFMKYILLSILNGLDYLHSNKIIHGCLNTSNVCFDKIGALKITGYGFKNALGELQKICEFGNEKTFREKTISEKSDIFELGLLILKVMNLTHINEKHITVPDFDPPELKELVEKCLVENEKERWSTKKLLSHKFLRASERKESIQRKKWSGGEGDLKIDIEEMEKSWDEFFEVGQNINSRLMKEFIILNRVGHGSFGKVLKVKNKLDGSIYAIKAIRLNTRDKILMRKMTTEVKLLSKLNHENVVRYYTSWIENDSSSVNNFSTDVNLDTIDGSSVKNKNLGESNKILMKSYKQNEEDDEDDDDDYDDDDDDDDEEDDDDEDVDDANEGEGEKEDDDENDDKNSKIEKLVNKNDMDEGVDFLTKQKESLSIVFMHSSSKRSDIKNENILSKEFQENSSNISEPHRTMYIQMEFCDKSTLRTAINETNGKKLCEDEERSWRLFREIVEGLAYVHKQGIIHRDLKPENIFLDSNDHVKIGDYGLATISVASKQCSLTFSGTAAISGGDNNGTSQNMGNDYHTGGVGTSLYVAPESEKTSGKSYYNMKVDIYSLGIIFFEMFNGPFSTEMERIKSLLNLRKNPIVFPSLWIENLRKKKSLVEKLLNHDPKSRPSCQEILEGQYLPPAEFEYEQLQEMMTQTLSKPKSKAYKYLVDSCFNQETRIEEDVTYKYDSFRSEKVYFLLHSVKEKMENLLKKHGATYLPAPLLLPENEEYKHAETKVQLMTHSGSIVNLPFDLRLSFARYVALKAFDRIRRYTVERVYKEKKVHGLHPREQYECAFDLITPSSGIENAELEVLGLIEEILNEFKSLKNKNCLIRLNHSFLLKSLLEYYNLEKWHFEIFKILSKAKDAKYFKNKLEPNLQQLGIQSPNSLLNFLLKVDSLQNIEKELLALFNKRGKTLEKLKITFERLKTLTDRAERQGLKVPIKISVGVVCNSMHCSDIMFDVVYYEKQKGKKEECVTILSGCRYDGLIAQFRKLFDLTTSGLKNDAPSAVGLTIYLDKMAAALKDNILSENVVVCSLGNQIFSSVKESVIQRLNEAGIKCYLEQTVESLEELMDYCRGNKIIHIIILKEKESSCACVMSWDESTNYFIEKKINIRDIPDYIHKYSKSFESHSPPIFSRQISEFQPRPSICEQTINIHLLFTDEKVTPNLRKKYENQIRNKICLMTGNLFSGSARLEIVGVFLDEEKVTEIILNFNKLNSSSNDIESILDRNADKKYVTKIFSKFKSILSDNSKSVIILYSLTQDKFYFPLAF